MLNGAVSLLTNFSTQFHVLSADSIQSDLASARAITWTSWPPSNKKPTLPNASETAYVIWANRHKLEIGLPSDSQFEEKRNRSTNIRQEKFSLLEDVQDGHWYNILGEIVQIPNVSYGNRLTVYLSDYTPNTHFYNQAEPSNEPEEDEYGYSRTNPRHKASTWPGPYGKMSIQLTLWDDQADFVRGKEGKWVLMRNVQIKSSGGLLEGVLRNDPGKSEGTLLIDVMEKSGEPDPRYKEALRRKLEHTRRFQERANALKDETSSSGNKQKSDEENKKPNSKQRRKEKRAAVMQKPNLNENSK